MVWCCWWRWVLLCLNYGPLNLAWGEQAEGGWVVGRGRGAGWKGAARAKPCCSWQPLRRWNLWCCCGLGVIEARLLMVAENKV